MHAIMNRGSIMYRKTSGFTSAGRMGALPRSGFTLIEIMVVIVVIAIIAAMVAPNVFSNVAEAKVTAARAQMETLSAALDMYKLHNNRYPTTDQGLAALWEEPTVEPASNWKGPYLKKAPPKDPFKNEYVYICPGEVNPNGFDLYSLGADGEVGGEGLDADILAWETGGGE
jgi:general secretion pathway protein G